MQLNVEPEPGRDSKSTKPIPNFSNGENVHRLLFSPEMGLDIRPHAIKESPRYLEKVCVLFLDKCGREVKYTEVHIDKDGKIDFWPENFFDQGYKDLLGLVKE